MYNSVNLGKKYVFSGIKNGLPVWQGEFNMKHSKVKEDNYLPDYSSFFESMKDNSKITSKLLKSLLKSNLVEFICSTLMFIVKHCAVWIIPIITANVIDIATKPESHALSELFINGAVLVLLVVQNLFTHVIYMNYTSRALRSIGAGLRNSLVKKLQQLSITYQNELKSGELQSKFLRDTEAIEQLLNQLIFNLIPCIMTIIVTVCVTVSKSLIVTAFFAVIIPINIMVVRMFRNKMKKDNRVFRKQVENVSGQIATMLEMIPVTKAHGLENTEINKMETSLKHMKEAGMMLDHSQAQFGSWAWVAGNLMSAVCLVFTGYMAYIGKLSVGEVVLFQSYFNTITGNIQSLLNIYPEFAKGSESVKSVSEVMISDNIENNEGKIKLRYVHGTVQFKNVSYKYPGSDKNVIKNFSLDVEPGDCVALVGASGSGKSTIMNMIIGFLHATEGEINIDGKPIEMLNLQDYRHFLSVVPQNCILFSGTIKENIVYGLAKYSEKRLEQVIDLANIREFTDKLPDGINTVVEEHGGNLSGGQKQRISIARALMRDPKIIILDEATSALDNISEYHVQQAMSSLIKGRTTFIVAHRLSTIRDANKIVVMEDGECVESGTYDELMKKHGKFFELKTLNEVSS